MHLPRLTGHQAAAAAGLTPGVCCSDGSICLDIIQDKWSPCHSVSTILTSIQSLLTDPNCGSPANPDAAKLFQQDRQEYNRRVRRVAAQSIDC